MRLNQENCWRKFAIVCALCLSSGIALADVFQAENYTNAFDTTPGNTGRAYRNENVDIEITTDVGGGYNVGWIEKGEWLTYEKLVIPSAGQYLVKVRVASPNGGSLNVNLNANAINLGDIAIPATGGWQTWQTVTKVVTLNAGSYTLGVYANTGGWNFNWIEITPANTNTWKLVWSDEFNGSTIDASKWSLAVNGNGGGNNELQYYTNRSENARVENGHLVIEARKEQFTGQDGTRQYTSARLDSRGKGDWLYGRLEARMKLPQGQGMWPAFWMLPTDNKYGAWAASGEIDILEAVNTNAAGGNKIYGTIHYGNAWPNNLHSGVDFTPATNVASNYHTYAVEWEPTQIRWYVDAVLYSTQTKWSSGGGAFPAPFDQKFYSILNLAVGGQWPGSPDSTTVFPQKLEVDYVRMYQK